MDLGALCCNKWALKPPNSPLEGVSNQVHCSPVKLLYPAITDLETAAQMSRRNNPTSVNTNFKCNNCYLLRIMTFFFFFPCVNIKMVSQKLNLGYMLKQFFFMICSL